MEDFLDYWIEKIDNKILEYEFCIENMIDFERSMIYCSTQLRGINKNGIGILINLMDEKNKMEFLKKHFKEGKIWIWSVLLIEDKICLSNNKKFLDACLKINPILDYLKSKEYIKQGMRA